MKNHNVLTVSVYLHNIGFVEAGNLIIDNDKHCSTFIYKKKYIEHNYPSINPSTLNWKINKTLAFTTTIKDTKQMLDRTFWEMLPNQNDWGNQVLITRFPEYKYMNNSQKILFLGNHVIGGMKITVNEDTDETNINNIDYLEKIKDESILLHQKHLKTIKYYGAIKPLTSYGGVRPKCMYEENGEFWIVKFNLPDDIYDMAISEQVALNIAKDSGLNVAESKIVQLPSGENTFFSKRFDRIKSQRYHSLSLFSLVPGNEHYKSNTGEFIYKLIEKYSDFANKDTIQIITKLLLDIGLNNTDNHLRNIRIILNNEHKWELAPLYDITFTPYEQPHVYNPIDIRLGELYLENPEIINIMSEKLGIKKSIIEEQREKVVKNLYKWEEYCDKYNMKSEDKDLIAKSISIGLTRSKEELTIKKSLTNKPKNTIPYPKLKPI